MMNADYQRLSKIESSQQSLVSGTELLSFVKSVISSTILILIMLKWARLNYGHNGQIMYFVRDKVGIDAIDRKTIVSHRERQNPG